MSIIIVVEAQLKGRMWGMGDHLGLWFGTEWTVVLRISGITQIQVSNL
jgi:hypothetical protein